MSDCEGKRFGADFTIETPQSPTLDRLLYWDESANDLKESTIQNLVGNAGFDFLPSAVQGDVLYHNGSDWVVLNAGTSGQVLQTNGGGANPIWGYGLQFTSQTQTLNNAGDTFNFDLSVISPLVDAKKMNITVLEKDTGSGTLFAQSAEFNQLLGSGKYQLGGVIGDYIYYAPDDSGSLKIVRVNYKTKFAEEIGSSLGATNDKYKNGITDGSKVFWSAGALNNILIYDTLDETTTQVSSTQSATYTTVSKGIDGKLYFFFGKETAGSSALVIEFDPIAETVDATYGSSSSTSQLYNFSVVSEENIYAFSQSTANVLKFNTNTKTITNITTSTANFHTGIQLGNTVYRTSRDGSQIQKFDLTTESDTYINTGLTPTTPYFGSSVSLYDKIYFLPNLGTGHLELDPSDDSLALIGSETLTGVGIAINDTIYSIGDRAIEFRLFNDLVLSPSNPTPYNSVSNIFDNTNINRVASIEDYNIDITEDGGGNATDLDIEMLTEGQKEITVNVSYVGQ